MTPEPIDIPISVNFTMTDAERINKFASDSGMPRSTFLRSIVLEYLKKKGR